MANRPNFIDIRSDACESPGPDLPSPRAGEIPPALSPLDALALQGRLLARRFDEQQKMGRRISRLPPLTIQNEFGRPRPGYFRSMSTDDHYVSDEDLPDVREEDKTPRSAKETTPDTRPVSHYPFIQTEGPSPLPVDNFRSQLSPLNEADSAKAASPHAQDYFGIPRTSSPDPIDHVHSVSQRPSHEGLHPPRLTDSSLSSHGSLRPPRSPAPQRSPRASPSIRSVLNDASDDLEGLSLGNSLDSLPPRQPFANTSYSRSHSPCSPMTIPRSPSVSSEYSTGGSRLSRPAHNFSRPLSSQPSFDNKLPLGTPPRPSEDFVRPSADTPSRQDSADSSLVPHDIHTPVSMTSDDYQAAQDMQNQPAPSYIYSKYSLPRGRIIKRESLDASTILNQFFKDDSSVPDRNRRPPSPPSPLRQLGQSSSSTLEYSLPIRGASMDHQSPRSRFPSTPTSTAASSSATLRPRTAQSIVDMSPEEHLEQGIHCHEMGSLQKSTYHLRLAARAGHPTAMLLYALACRHGWGMRQNEAEGFQWLKKAVDCAQLEIAEDEDLTKQGKAMDFQERKTHKARFALGIYELGKSYMEGWGIQQDRALALRCFEIAGNWGDADALTEAGYCYAEGLGCKKDLKKAARFYRQAAAKGASMVGQSWIYKEKYMDDEGDDVRLSRSAMRKDSSDKKPRDKSRTRTIFGRKKSATQSSQ